ncbi:hypothetical protein TSAR_002560 [Trichomalopsis sarcophagae]|uniref:Branched-chain-amino-acid aminotransferase n=1 Tax=Trichomalopsis sarcophagae TaxID=543379 RepID=A0A232EUM0_9HYME|nr:hypothetical protein TSAR_002560 [Trichomalopsis sarcophagae]
MFSRNYQNPKEKLANVLPIFEPQSVDTWIGKVEELRIVNGWNEDTTLFLAASRLQGKTKDWHESGGKRVTSWTEWKEKLRQATKSLEEDRIDEAEESKENVLTEENNKGRAIHKEEKGRSSHTPLRPINNQQLSSTKTPKLPRVQLSIGLKSKNVDDPRFREVQVNGRQLLGLIDLASDVVTIRRREAVNLDIPIRSVSEKRVDLLGYDGSIVRLLGICEIGLQVDLAKEATVQAYVVPNEAQESPIVVGSVYLDRPGVTVLRRNGLVRVLDSTALEIKGLEEEMKNKPVALKERSANGKEEQDRRTSEKMVHLRRKILSFGGLLNQLQPNVRWSSSLKIRDKEAVQPERTFKYSDMSVRLAAPHQLQPKPNVSDLAFGKYFTDHMLKVFYYEALGGWQMPEITPFENLVLHPAAKVLHYAIELFEGMKAYRGVDGKIRVFRPDMNMDRMNASAVRSGLPTFNGMELIKCINRLISIDQEWVPHSEASSLYIRPTLIGIDPTLGVATSDSAMLYVILSPVGSYFKSKESLRGVSLLADPRYTRAWPGGCGDRKMGSNYAPTIHVQKEATEKGLQQVLWLYGDDHQLTEAGTMNIFLFCINDQGEKELITPPLSGLILPGITRNSILAMTKEWNQFKVTERTITMTEVRHLLSENRCLELFGAGTACIVSPVSYIEYMGQGLHIPTLDHAEPVHRLIHKQLTEIQYGYVDHPWAMPIE